MSSSYDAVLKLLLEAVEKTVEKPQAQKNGISVGISNRHLHLSQEDVNALFGEGYQLTVLKELSQPGQFGCKETVTICGPKGAIEKVRVLGPVRSKTQVEILAGDCFKLGVKAPARLSGDLDGTPGATLIGPKGSVQLKEGLIVAQRHIHMHTSDALVHGVKDGQMVGIELDGVRGGVFRNVAIRVTDDSALELHVDMEEANAMSLTSASVVEIAN
ncbi:phosphate propanoyltransferase [Halodesulfovibrio sp.]|jgi:propanediol utilization protein|uniref:phosphate propanoyltransferase n=1 Tax=Halodesulfovibrio sp. TaxID=1912772 RepID=UPI0025E5DE28|nr:phosphate propanoyltransferase [Halodesulfovibrio sp.]MCT4535111.1 phosphate propanoyltransferase [Halodesulfovibrio sp.]MCT4627409.1 phosphate propanoyltransferase [Halodesulfovibrio sp.]